MDRQAATTLARSLFEVAHRMQLVTQEGAPSFKILVRDIRDLLTQLMPDGEGIAVEGNLPHILVATDETLFVVSLVLQDGTHELRLSSAPLDAHMLTIQLEEWYDQKSQGFDVRHRTWILDGGSLQKVSVRTEDYVGEEEPVDEERFLRQIAARIGGWHVAPQDDDA